MDEASATQVVAAGSSDDTTSNNSATSTVPSAEKDSVRGSPETANLEMNDRSSPHAHEDATVMSTLSVPATTKDVRIIEPHDHDIIKGRGGGVNKHPGNVRFRTWVDARKKRYALSRSKAEKVRVAQEVIDLIKGLSPPGRFLKMECHSPSSTSSTSSPNNYWVEMDAEATMTKVSQALREGAPNIRQQEKSEQVTDSPFPYSKHPNGVSKAKQPNVAVAKPLTLPALGQQRPNALLAPSLKRPKNTSTTTTSDSWHPQPHALSTVEEKSNHKRRMHPGSEMSPYAVAEQQESVRLQVLQRQREAEEEAQQQRSAKRSKPRHKTDSAGGSAAAVVPGSPIQQEQGYLSPEEQEQQQQKSPALASSGKKRGLAHVSNGSSRKRSASKTRTENTSSAAANNINKSLPSPPPPPTSFLILRLDQLEERQGDLESQLLEEKKQRLKQEQRQGALELQLLEAKTMRMKQDDVIKSLRREIAQLQQQQQQQHHTNNNSNKAAVAQDEDDEDGENSREDPSVGTYVV